MPTPRPNAIHREWFQDTAYGVCDCGSNKRSRRKEGKDPTVYVWGEYVSAKWRTVRRVCECCFQGVIIPQLRAHADPCGCSFQMRARSGHSLPPWITLEGSGIRCAT
jgi:hypothetical protein